MKVYHTNTPSSFSSKKSGKLGAKVFYFVILLLHDAQIISEHLLK